MRTRGLSGTLVPDVYKLDFGTMALYGVDQQGDGGIERFTTPNALTGLHLMMIKCDLCD